MNFKTRSPFSISLVGVGAGAGAGAGAGVGVGAGSEVGACVIIIPGTNNSLLRSVEFSQATN